MFIRDRGRRREGGGGGGQSKETELGLCFVLVAAAEQRGRMMDDNLLNAQCADITKCINGLYLTLTEADRTPAGINKIINDVQKLIKSFSALGKHYAVELVKKCRELEAKNQEVETLSRKLQQFQGESNLREHSFPTPDCHVDGHKRQRTDADGGAEPQGRSVSELSKRQGDLFEGAAERNDFQVFETRPAQVERSGEDSTFRTGTRNGTIIESGKGKERLEGPAVGNPSVSRVSQTMQQQLVQEQSAVENSRSVMKGYHQDVFFEKPVHQDVFFDKPVHQDVFFDKPVHQDVFYEKPIHQDVFFDKSGRGNDFKNVIYLSPKKTLRGDYQHQVSGQQTTLPHPAYVFQR